MNKNRIIFGAFMLIGFLQHSRSAASPKIFDDQLIESLPSPMASLKSADLAGPQIQSSLIEEIAINCHSQTFSSAARINKGCRIPDLVQKYNVLLSELKGGAHGIDVNAPLKTKAWDLSNLLTGQFILIPNPKNQNAGLDLVVELLMTRNEISHAIDRYYIPANKQIDWPTPLKNLAAPYLKAYLTTSSPLGALNVVYQNIKCEAQDLACHNTKLIWRNICSIAIKTNSKSFDDLERRLSLAMNDSSAKGLARLKLIQSIHDYILNSQFDKPTLRQKLLDLDSDGQSGFADSDYADLAMQFLVFNEIDHLLELKKSGGFAESNFTQKTSQKFETEMNSLSIQTFRKIENAVVKFGVLNEAGGA